MNVLGWILVPYLTVFIQWKKLSVRAKFGAFFLSEFVLSIEVMIFAGIYHNPNISLIIPFHFFAQLVLYFIFGMVYSLREEKQALLSGSGGAENVVSLVHVSGLDVGSTECHLFLFPDKLKIESTFTNQIFEIPLSSIYQAEAENIRKDNAFSFGKAVLGEAVAGPLGAILAGSLGGSSATTKGLLKIGFIGKENAQRELFFFDNATFRAVNFSVALRKKMSLINPVNTEPVVHQL